MIRTLHTCEGANEAELTSEPVLNDEQAVLKSHLCCYTVTAQETQADSHCVVAHTVSLKRGASNRTALLKLLMRKAGETTGTGFLWMLGFSGLEKTPGQKPVGLPTPKEWIKVCLFNK